MAGDQPYFLPRNPNEITAYPWLCRRAVDFFESILKPEARVIEHGAGGSTLWLANRVKQVISIEHNPGWAQKIIDYMLDNVTIVAEIPASSETFDIFFIDGDRLERADCLRLANQFVKPGGWVVLDNANHDEYKNERASLHAQGFVLKERYNANMPGRTSYCITEFWQRKE
jgi:predicted O-methyltransferase YrrM